jgi:hypothetical protein
MRLSDLDGLTKMQLDLAIGMLEEFANYIERLTGNLKGKKIDHFLGLQPKNYFVCPFMKTTLSLFVPMNVGYVFEIYGVCLSNPIRDGDIPLSC